MTSKFKQLPEMALNVPYLYVPLPNRLTNSFLRTLWLWWKRYWASWPNRGRFCFILQPFLSVCRSLWYTFLIFYLPTCLIILLLAEKQIIIICSTTYITTPIFTYFVDCTLAETLWDQPDGGAYTEGCYTVLRLCNWKAKGPLP